MKSVYQFWNNINLWHSRTGTADIFKCSKLSRYSIYSYHKLRLKIRKAGLIRIIIQTNKKKKSIPRRAFTETLISLQHSCSRLKYDDDEDVFVKNLALSPANWNGKIVITTKCKVRFTTYFNITSKKLKMAPKKLFSIKVKCSTEM